MNNISQLDELVRLRAEVERADVMYQRACEVEHELRAEVERWQAEAAEMSAQRSHNANQAGRLRAEVERLKQQIKDDNRSYGCELRDPNGTIWEQAAKDYARAERAEADKARLDWLESPAGFDWQWNSAHSVIVRRAAIDAAMKP